MDTEKPKKKYNYTKKPGRPTKYTPELIDEICEAIASSELGLQHLCDANPHWPERARIFIWRRKYPEFKLKYDKAKEEQTDVCLEYMQEIVNEPHTYTDKDTGDKRVDVAMLKVKLDNMKWQMAKLKPKKFGDAKSDVDTSHAAESQKALEHEKRLEEAYKKDC